MDGLFTVWIVPFEAQNVFIFMTFVCLFLFSFVTCAFGDRAKKWLHSCTFKVELAGFAAGWVWGGKEKGESGCLQAFWPEQSILPPSRGRMCLVAGGWPGDQLWIR